MLPVAEAIRAVPDDRRDRGEHASEVLGVEADLAADLEVERVGDRWGVDRDQCGDADEHQRLGVEGRRVERVGGHSREQVEHGRVVVGRIGHDGSLHRWWNRMFRPRGRRLIAPPSRGGGIIEIA